MVEMSEILSMQPSRDAKRTLGPSVVDPNISVCNLEEPLLRIEEDDPVRFFDQYIYVVLDLRTGRPNFLLIGSTGRTFYIYDIYTTSTGGSVISKQVDISRDEWPPMAA